MARQLAGPHLVRLWYIRPPIQSVPAAANQNQMKTIRGQEPGQLEADSARRAGHQRRQRCRVLGSIVSPHASYLNGGRGSVEAATSPESNSCRSPARYNLTRNGVSARWMR